MQSNEKDLQKVPLNSISGVVDEKQDDKSESIIKKIFQRLHEHSGLWYMLTANMIFACSTFALKFIPADMFDIMVVRFFVQGLVFGVFANCYKKYSLFDTSGQPVACLLNIFMSSATNFTYIAAYYFLPLSDLNTIKYTYIVWAAILSVIFLKDRFKLVNAIALLFTAMGLVLATKPHLFFKVINYIFTTPMISNLCNATNENTTISIANGNPSFYYLGVGLASLSALTKAILMIARKQLIKMKLPYSVINFQFTVAGLFVSTLYSIIRRFWVPEPVAWKWTLIVGCIFGAIQLLTNTFMAKALKRENVQILAIVGSLDIVYAVILQYIVFRQTKTWIFYLGAAFIVISAVILSVDRHLVNERQRKKEKMKLRQELNQNGV